jgi:hypothetical protein
MHLVHMFAVSRMLIYETWEKSMLSLMSEVMKNKRLVVGPADNNLEVFAERYIFESL